MLPQGAAGNWFNYKKWSPQVAWKPLGFLQEQDLTVANIWHALAFFGYIYIYIFSTRLWEITVCSCLKTYLFCMDWLESSLSRENTGKADLHTETQSHQKSCPCLDLSSSLSPCSWWLSLKQSTSLPSDVSQTRQFPEKHSQHTVKSLGWDKQ